MAPSRGVKSWVTEGGIRCPCVIHYPPFRPEPNAVSPAFTTVMDILPTILELAGVKHPGKHFRNRDVHPPRGRSWVPHLSSSNYRSGTVHGEDEHIHGWEFLGQRAIREGKWKAIFVPPPRGQNTWELYNLEEDIAELHDRSGEHPALLEKLILHWEQYYSETGMIPTPMLRPR
jgi:arylsulfatase A-like enzyme